MHAYLLVGNSEKFISALNYKKIEFPLLKIDDTRDLFKFTQLKLGEKTAIIIRDFDNANEVTQNAFLKSLEEPQENLIFVLTATNIERVLPTIASRTEVIENLAKNNSLSDEEEEKAKEFIDSSIGKRFEIASKISKKEEAIKFFNNLIIYCHNEMKEGNKNIWKIAEEAISFNKNLSANGNVTLQVTNFVLKIS